MVNYCSGCRRQLRPSWRGDLCFSCGKKYVKKTKRIGVKPRMTHELGKLK